MEKQNYGIDLHIHTTGSDGTRTVEETISDARKAGIGVIALTDHNQFTITEPKYCGELELIPGAEFSAAYCTQAGRLLEVHIIGLFFHGVPKELQQIFKKIPQQRKRYLDAIIARLNYLGIDISYEKLMESFPDSHQIGRRHIAEILVQKNYADSITDAFDRLIGNRSPYWVDVNAYMRYMPLEMCVRKICENDGFPILAHPYHYHCPDEEVEQLIAEFTRLARKHPAGIEVYYSKYDTEQREKLLRLSKQYGLYPSAASDRHSADDKFEMGDSKLLEAMKEAVR